VDTASLGRVIPAQRQPSDPIASFPDDDPRARQDGLGWVTRAVFGDPRLRLTVGEAPAATFRYAVIPALGTAKFLLPLASRRVTAASLLAYNALRPARVRLSRAVIGSLARAGLLGVTRAPVLSVEVPPGAEVLWTHLAGLLGKTRLHAAIGIRPPDPHHKPTLQLFDDQGRPRGYAKIGWNDGTRAMVRAEAATLADLPPAGGDLPDIPRLLLHTTWHDREIAIIEPMPRDVRRLADPDRPLTAAMLAVARRGGPATPAVEPGALLAAWRRRAAEVLSEVGDGPAVAGTQRPAGNDPESRAAGIGAAIDAVEARDGALRVEFGDWHGDWVPWNMATHDGGRLIVWDWENRSAGVPLGFDLAHQAFQTALSTRGWPAAQCAGAVDEALRAHGPALGLDTAAKQRFVADAYLIELWVRTYELSHGGAGWNPKLHPALLEVLTARLRLGAAAATPPPD
jgi:hypothetical protein